MKFKRIRCAKALFRLAARPDVSVALGIALALYFAYHATRFRISDVWPPTPIGDAAILYGQSQQIFEAGDYPARLEESGANGVFPYPPSAVMVLHWLGLGGPMLFMAVWFAAMAGGLVTTLRVSLGSERGEMRSAWLVIGAAALAVADSPVSWDLRNANSNLIYLGLVLGGYSLMDRRPATAGLLVGLSVALKLQSGLLLLWLLIGGAWRALSAGVAVLLLLAIVAPLLALGWNGAARLYLGWFEQLRIISDAQIHAALAASDSGPPIVSLGKAAMALTGEGLQGTGTRALIAALLSVWTAAVLWYLRQAARSFPAAVPSRAALADWTVLLLAPLPFSPWLEPYHAIPMLPAAILLVAVALDDAILSRHRRIAVAALLAIVAVRMVGLPFSMRGLSLLAQFLVATVALGLLRPSLPVIPAERSGGPRCDRQPIAT